MRQVHANLVRATGERPSENQRRVERHGHGGRAPWERFLPVAPSLFRSLSKVSVSRNVARKVARFERRRREDRARRPRGLGWRFRRIRRGSPSFEALPVGMLDKHSVQVWRNLFHLEYLVIADRRVENLIFHEYPAGGYTTRASILSALLSDLRDAAGPTAAPSPGVRMVEVGVFQGATAKDLVERVPSLRYTGVDPYVMVPTQLPEHISIP